MHQSLFAMEKGKTLSCISFIAYTLPFPFTKQLKKKLLIPLQQLQFSTYFCTFDLFILLYEAYKHLQNIIYYYSTIVFIGEKIHINYISWWRASLDRDKSHRGCGMPKYNFWGFILTSCKSLPLSCRLSLTITMCYTIFNLFWDVCSHISSES